MPIRTVCNQTAMTVKRSVRASALERVTATVTMAENNLNIIGAVVTAGTAIAYAGFDHRACPLPQYDLNAV